MKKISSEILASLLVVLFIYAGMSKLLDYSNFRFELGRSPYITALAGFIAWAMPAAEIITALLLTFKKTRLIGFYASFLLMVLFTGYIYAMLYYSPFLPCSCGGVLSLMSWDQHFYFNIFFVLLSALGVIVENKRENLREILTA